MEGLAHYEKDVRPWGNYERFTLNEATTVKIITVEPGEAFSLQMHAHRSEWWRILSGRGVVTVGMDTHQAEAGNAFFIGEGTNHRAQADTATPLVFLEIAFGEFDEHDITRLEDRYGRA